MGSRGLVPLQGVLKGGHSPFLSCMQAILIPEKTRVRFSILRFFKRIHNYPMPANQRKRPLSPGC
ncbi:hypothetical protein MBAV_004119 [Candidatus Magnetobacterium bavaricum]|uniref:Uncharacterized protein n=1 Tax=Candidatus Magnetobacterium bavaricum TaxID=29290 RepID=A0A0F3GSM1_9BACT|nr:hypothetical protein MBAV_004119 [Candidatus Magnetobacterium bavaricum]